MNLKLFSNDGCPQKLIANVMDRVEIIGQATFQPVAIFHLPSPALPLCLLVAALTEAKQLANLPDSALSSLPFNQIRSLES